MTAGEEVVVLDLGCSDLVEQVEKVRRTVQHISPSNISLPGPPDLSSPDFRV